MVHSKHPGTIQRFCGLFPQWDWKKKFGFEFCKKKSCDHHFHIILLFDTWQTQFVRARKQFCKGEKQENSHNQPLDCNVLSAICGEILSGLGWIDILLKLLYIALKSWYGVHETNKACKCKKKKKSHLCQCFVSLFFFVSDSSLSRLYFYLKLRVRGIKIYEMQLMNKKSFSREKLNYFRKKREQIVNGFFFVFIYHIHQG